MKVAAGNVPISLMFGATLMGSNPWMTTAQVLQEWSFASDSQGFVYEDDIFRGTSAPNYADGSFSSGSLTTTLGGVDNSMVTGMSGGWTNDFEVTGSAGGVRMVIEYSVEMSIRYELEEYIEVLCSVVDSSTGALVVEDRVFDLYEQETSSPEQRTGVVAFGSLSPGTYELKIGGYNNQKTQANEFADIFFYNVRLERYTVVPTPAPTSFPTSASTLYAWYFVSNNQGFAYQDDRFRNTNAPNYASGTWTEGAITVYLGGVDNGDVQMMSGGWSKDFAITEMTGVEMVMDYSVDISSNYEDDEYVEVLCNLFDNNRGVFILQDSVVDTFNSIEMSEGNRVAVVSFGTLPTGDYTLTVGAFNNQKTTFDEYGEIFFHGIVLEETAEGAATPTRTPTTVPTSLPTAQPTPAKTALPTYLLATRFSDIKINCGNPDSEFTDTSDNVWGRDQYFDGDSDAQSSNRNIKGTNNDDLYKRYRSGLAFVYEIPIFPGRDYDIFLHFAELATDSVDERVFDVIVNGEVKVPNLDIISEVGERSTPLVKYIFMENVASNFLRIEFTSVIDDAVVSAIAINEQLPHFAHAVPGGPYAGVDRDGSGFGLANVNGDQSHTHDVGEVLTEWNWYVGDQRVTPNATGDVTSLRLPVGVHSVFLDVIDSAGNFDGLATTVEIKPFGFPFIDLLSPNQGLIGDLEDSLTITGVGFTFTENETSVWIGPVQLSGPDQITIRDENTISVHAVPDARSTAGPVDVTVQTPIGTSPALVYEFIVDDPFEFDYGELAISIYGPTVVKFGPDGKLYVATQTGIVYKLTLDDDFNIVDTVVSAAIASTAGINPFTGKQEARSILGMTFDPSDLKPNPTVYLATSILFHREQTAWVERAVNGKIITLDGPDLDEMEDIITGLPVSDLDHAVNGLEFGQDGELYIQTGGNTNAGVPGRISSSRTMVDNYYSSATLVAYLTLDGFDGSLTYDADNGDPTGGLGVEVFAPGQRNPFDIVLHSNGFLYGTDNGPNRGFGDRSTGCLPEQIGSDPNEPDELNLIEQGKWYGHANRKRGETDPKQCIWRSAYEESDANYTAPLALLRSSTNGIIEFESEHFNGQLRGQLIMGKYNGGLFRGVLDEDGRSSTEVVPVPTLIEGGLQLTQAPDGSIFVARLGLNTVAWHRPVEAASLDLVVKSAFPRRGPRNGGMKITLYGENFGGSPVVTVGGAVCADVVVVNDHKMTCTTPPGTGNSDIVVTTATETATLAIGHRYTNIDSAPLGPASSPTLTPTTSPTLAPAAASPTPLWENASVTIVYKGGDFCPSANMNVNVEVAGETPPDVTVTLKNDALGIDLADVTNAYGRVKFAINIPPPDAPGQYSIEACAYDAGGAASCSSQEVEVLCSADPPTSAPTPTPAPMWDNVRIRTVYRNGDFCPNANMVVRVTVEGEDLPDVPVTLKNQDLGIDLAEITNPWGRGIFAVTVTEPSDPGRYSIEGCAYDDGGAAYCSSQMVDVLC